MLLEGNSLPFKLCLVGFQPLVHSTLRHSSGKRNRFLGYCLGQNGFCRTLLCTGTTGRGAEASVDAQSSWFICLGLPPLCRWRQFQACLLQLALGAFQFLIDLLCGLSHRNDALKRSQNFAEPGLHESSRLSVLVWRCSSMQMSCHSIDFQAILPDQSMDTERTKTTP